jgi:hypothetical protein
LIDNFDIANKKIDFKITHYSYLNPTINIKAIHDIIK